MTLKTYIWTFIIGFVVLAGGIFAAQQAMASVEVPNLVQQIASGEDAQLINLADAQFTSSTTADTSHGRFG